MKKRFFTTFFSALLMTICLGSGHSKADTSIENGPQVSAFGPVADAQIFFQPSQRGDGGVEPSVAINNDNYVVQIHKSQGSDGLWYRCGKVNANNVISWAASQKVEDGESPSIAITDDGYVVETHKSQNNDTLWYRVGKCNFTDRTIDWGSSHKYDGGLSPSIAITDDGYVVETHKSQHNDTLWYRVGKCNFTDRTIDWGSSHKYDGGLFPSIAITDDGYVVATHESQHYDTLWYRVGKCNFTDRTIDWGSSHKYDEGTSPSVAMNENFVVQVHKSQNKDTLWYSSALIIDHSRWMENLRHVIGDKPLWQITLPGTHDAGMYTVKDIEIESYSWWEWVAKGWIRDNWEKTQNQTIYQQLMGGVRYFDLRPAWHDNTLYIYHSFAGPEVLEVFADINQFMHESAASGAGELVILVLSHFHGFNKDGYKTLGSYVTTYLDRYLYKADSESANLLKTTFNQYTEYNGNSSPRILFLVESSDYEHWVYSGAKPPPGVWPYAKMDYKDSPWHVTGNMRIINDYANRWERSKMVSDQTDKLTYTKGGDAKRAFLLSWILTGGGGENWTWWSNRYVDRSLRPRNIHDMSQDAKSYLHDFLRDHSHRYWINILLTDYYQEAATPDLAYLMNKALLSEPPGPPALDIKANGHDDRILIRPGTPVSITVSLDPGYRENLHADWWIAVNTPMGWYSYVDSEGWQPGLQPYIQTPLIGLTSPLELPGVSLGNGLYIYYFAVDDNADGVPDAAWVDQVVVNITSWR